MITDLRQLLRAGLEQGPRPEPAPGDRAAAVLALVVERPTPAILFTERSAAMSRHAGEVSFPGGLHDAGDSDLVATALRETHEEIGLHPSVPDVLGALPSVHTYVSAVLVAPFVAAVEALPALVPSQSEIERVATVPIETLLGVEEQRTLVHEGEEWTGWWYVTESLTVWGATGSMLHSLLDLIREVR